MGVAFSILVTIVIAGFLWFWIVRPILEDFNLIAPRSVNDYEEAAPIVMSRSEDNAPASLRPSLETGNQTDRQTEQVPRIRAEELLTLYRLMRAAGIGREEAAAAFKASGLPFNNNVWRDATPEEPPHVTPIVGRATNAQFDHDYPYRPLEV